VQRAEYYEQLKALARDVRDRFGFLSARVLRSDLRRIYKAEGIRIDLWPHKLKKLRGAYFSDVFGTTVMLAKGLPEDPMVFTMAHELKHHLTDRGMALSYCDASNQSNPIEIGAEVFAAELIYPEGLFRSDIEASGAVKGRCTAEMIVRLKRQTRTTLSYAGLVKRAEFLGFVAHGAFSGVRWKKLEEEIFGIPSYKRYRKRR
jgi:Zn-dependent peptidase ImmA (M78 family)